MYYTDNIKYKVKYMYNTHNIKYKIKYIIHIKYCKDNTHNNNNIHVRVLL